MWIDDQLIRRCDKDLVTEMWLPTHPLVVLGRSNQAHQEVNEAQCERDGVPVLQRYGGGGTVLLHPNCLVVSVGAWVSSPYQNDLYFKLLNQSVMRTIQKALSVELAQKGYSDIVWGMQKVAGTSLFRSRQYLLYQASILVETEIDAIELYLKHPSREPDYRGARSHRQFLSSLNDVARVTGGSELSAEEWLNLFQTDYKQIIRDLLVDELVEPVSAHIPHLLKRAQLADEVSSPAGGLA
jgi:lipoate-protein ligase A